MHWMLLIPVMLFFRIKRKDQAIGISVVNNRPVCIGRSANVFIVNSWRIVDKFLERSQECGLVALIVSFF